MEEGTHKKEREYFQIIKTMEKTTHQWEKPWKEPQKTLQT